MSLCCCWHSYIWRLLCYKCTRSSIIESYYEDKQNLSNKLSISCCFLTHLFCWPFHICYICDKLNFQPKEEFFDEEEQAGKNDWDKKGATNKEFVLSVIDPVCSGDQLNDNITEGKKTNPENNTVTIQQPYKVRTKFHYTNTFFKSFLYIAIEGKEESKVENANEEFYFWIKIPFNFNIDLDDRKDPDLL